MTSKTIFLDPGHGGRDPGAVNGARRESDDNLRLALAVRPRLQQHGFNVLMSRETDIEVSLLARTNMANAANSDMLISLHRNGWHDPGANGTEVIVYLNPTAADEALADLLMDELVSAGIQRSRGVKRMNMHMLRESKMTSILPELGFISNARDNELFDGRFEYYVAAVVRSVCAFYGVPYNNEPQKQRARISLASYELPRQEAQMREHLAAIRAIPGFEDAWPVITDMTKSD